MFCDTHGCRRFIPSSQRCKTCLRGRGTDLKSAQAFGQHDNNSTSSDGLMDACLYGDVAQWLERGKLINLRGRRFESFHLHDYIAIPYSSKTRSSNIWKVGLFMASWQSLVYCEWPEPICAVRHRRFESS